MSAEALGEHNLSLFTWESKAWHTVGIIICRCSRRNRRLGMSLEALERIICRYLRGNLKLGMLVGGYRVPRKVFVFSACRRL